MKGFDYKVTKQYLKDLESPIALFKNNNDATSYALWLLEKDVNMRVETIYRVYDEEGISTSYTSKDVKPGSASASGSSSGQKSKVQFNPSPFQTTPAPGGSRSYTSFVDTDEKDDKKKR